MMRATSTLVLLCCLTACELEHLSRGDGGAGGQAGGGQGGGQGGQAGGQAGGPSTGGSGGTTSEGGAGGCMGSYRDVVLCDQPVGYWRLGDSGITAVDELGMNDGQYDGNVMQSVMGAIAGDPDTAVEFPGADSLVSFGDVFDFEQLSVEAWIKPVMVDATYRFIVSKETTDNQNGYGLYVQQVEGISFDVVVGGQHISARLIQVPLNEWLHLVGTWNGTTARLFVNGVPQTSSPFPMTLTNNSEPFKIGAFDTFGNSGIIGVIDEVAIYDYPLPQTRVDAHYEAGTR